MASVNKVIRVGNLGTDPEVRGLPSGDALENVRLATTDRYKDKTSSEFKEMNEWHRVSFFGRIGESVAVVTSSTAIERPAASENKG
jgi:single-strand DNA-binding protein